MKSITPIACVILFAQIANAATLFEDTFSDGNTRDGWVQRVNGGTTYGYNGVATIVPGAGQPSSLWHNFADTVLERGAILKLSVDVMMSDPASQTRPIRFGLGYSGAPLVDGSNNNTPVDGYHLGLPFLGNDSDPQYQWMDGPINWGNALTTSFGAGALDNTDIYTVDNAVLRTISFEISRSPSDVLCAEASVNGAYAGSVILTVQLPNFEFNALGFMAPYNAGETFSYDNVKLELIPPPVYPVLFEDSFSDGNSRGCWIQRNTGATSYAFDGAATIVPGSGQPSSLWHNFADTVLQEGQTLKLSVDVMMTDAAAQSSPIRFGLGSYSALPNGGNGNIQVDGYICGMPFLGNNNNPFFSWMDGPINWGNAETVGFGSLALDNNDIYTVNNAVLRPVSFEITRGAGNILNARVSVNGEYTGDMLLTTLIPGFSFNAFGLIAPYNFGETFSYDNVKVEIVEETRYPLANWTFNDTSTLAAAMSASNVASGSSISSLSINNSFDFAGLNAEPSTANDGYGFGASGGANVIFLHRANFFAPGTSWTQGTGGDMSDDSNASMLFTVTADPGQVITIESLTHDLVSNTISTTLFDFAEAGESRGASSPGGLIGDNEVDLPAPVTVGSGETRSFIIWLNSGVLNSGHRIDDFTLNGNILPRTPTVIRFR
jgi:hypothetical protein